MQAIGCKGCKLKSCISTTWINLCYTWNIILWVYFCGRANYFEVYFCGMSNTFEELANEFFRFSMPYGDMSMWKQGVYFALIWSCDVKESEQHVFRICDVIGVGKRNDVLHLFLHCDKGYDKYSTSLIHSLTKITNTFSWELGVWNFVNSGLQSVQFRSLLIWDVSTFSVGIA